MCCISGFYAHKNQNATKAWSLSVERVCLPFLCNFRRIKNLSDERSERVLAEPKLIGVACRRWPGLKFRVQTCTNRPFFSYCFGELCSWLATTPKMSFAGVFVQCSHSQRVHVFILGRIRRIARLFLTLRQHKRTIFLVQHFDQAIALVFFREFFFNF